MWTIAKAGSGATFQFTVTIEVTVKQTAYHRSRANGWLYCWLTLCFAPTVVRTMSGIVTMKALLLVYQPEVRWLT